MDMLQVWGIREPVRPSELRALSYCFVLAVHNGFREDAPNLGPSNLIIFRGDRQRTLQNYALGIAALADSKTPKA